MAIFIIICTLICAGIFGLILWWYQHQSSLSDFEKEKLLFTRFKADLETRVSKGHLEAQQAEEESAEASRALLKANSIDNDHLTPNIPIKNAVKVAVFSTILMLSLVSYFYVGKFGMADQPYTQRVKLWQALSQKHPEQLDYAQMAIVLRQYAKARDKDPQFWGYMGEMDLQAKNFVEAIHDYEHLIGLVPNSSPAWTQLGMALVFESDGKPGPQARAAFERAIALDPNNIGAQYFIAKMDAEAGEFAKAHDQFVKIGKALSPEDPRKDAVEQELINLKQARENAQAANAQIQKMVEGLAAQLRQNPENSDGWARLLRSYRVLKDDAAVKRTQTLIENHYAQRPDQVKIIMQKSQGPVGEQGMMN